MMQQIVSLIKPGCKVKIQEESKDLDKLDN